MRVRNRRHRAYLGTIAQRLMRALLLLTAAALACWAPAALAAPGDISTVAGTTDAVS